MGIYRYFVGCSCLACSVKLVTLNVKTTICAVKPLYGRYTLDILDIQAGKKAFGIMKMVKSIINGKENKS